jgi:cell division protease FtsH
MKGLFMPPPREPGSPRQKKRPDTMPGGWIWIVVLLAFFLVIVTVFGVPQGNQVTFGQFEELAKAQKFDKIEISGEDRVLGRLKKDAELPDELKNKAKGGVVQATIPFEKNKVYERLEKVGFPPEKIHTVAEPTAWVLPFVLYVLPTILLIGFFIFFILPRFRDPLGGGFLNNYVKSPAKRFDKSKMRTTFADVADMQNAKQELQEIVEFLKNPEKFQRLGAQVPKGVLLIGQPGTGKTLLARAVAGEAGVPFFSISGSEFIQMFVGVGASRVRDMFRTAKENSPCLIFIDEIDAVGRMRGAGVGGGSDEREQTLNQILSEMDGFTPTESVIVIAATNRPDVLDSALLRPGRFDRHITVDRPTWQGRLEILKVHTRNKPLSDDVNLEYVARKMIGMTGADLRNLANEAALLATRENKSRIEPIDFERAADRVLLGAKREEVLTEDIKRRTAYHEAGHAIVGWFMPAGDPPSKVSIVPRGGTGGVTMFVPEEEENFHRGLDHFKAILARAMGGRAAERLLFNQPYAGVEGDLKQSTRIARYMVTHWGMSETLGPMSFRVGEEHVFLGKELQEQRDFSDQTAFIIDQEVQKLLREADDTAYRILVEHRDKLERMVKILLEKEEILKEEIEEICGKRAGVNGAAASTPPPNGQSTGIVASEPAHN